MPKSSAKNQICKCGRGEQPHVVVTIYGASVGAGPRVKTTAVTLYICPYCSAILDAEVRNEILKQVSEIAQAITQAIEGRIPQ